MPLAAAVALLSPAAQTETPAQAKCGYDRLACDYGCCVMCEKALTVTAYGDPTAFRELLAT